jgi:peptidoglycan/LPS O-acetylase OafA/YrhL
VVVGFVATAALSVGTDQLLHATHVYPPWGVRMSDGLFAIATAYRVPYAVLGGWIAATLAPRSPMRHAWILAWVGTFFAIVGAAATWNRPELGPRWYPVALVVTALPCVLGGGWLRARREVALGAGG